MVMLFVTSAFCCVETMFICSQIHSKFMLHASSLIPWWDSCPYPELWCFWAIAAFVLLLWVQLFLVPYGQGVELFPHFLCRINQTLPFLCFLGVLNPTAFREAVEVCTEGTTELLVSCKLLPSMTRPALKHLKEVDTCSHLFIGKPTSSVGTCKKMLKRPKQKQQPNNPAPSPQKTPQAIKQKPKKQCGSKVF